jgi:hypothetical protein
MRSYIPMASLVLAVVLSAMLGNSRSALSLRAAAAGSDCQPECKMPTGGDAGFAIATVGKPAGYLKKNHRTDRSWEKLEMSDR